MAIDARTLTDRGFSEADPEALEAAVRAALATMEPLAYGDSSDGLTRGEQAVLRAGGLTLEPVAGEDPLARTAATFAALIASALSTRQASARIGRGEARVRQMLVDRSLSSFVVDGVRHLPAYQFAHEEGLVPNVTVVNRALRPALHPVEVYRWFHRPNEDLFEGDDIDATVSPLAWIAAGHDPERVAMLAARL